MCSLDIFLSFLWPLQLACCSAALQARHIGHGSIARREKRHAVSASCGMGEEELFSLDLPTCDATQLDPEEEPLTPTQVEAASPPSPPPEIASSDFERPLEEPFPPTHRGRSCNLSSASSCGYSLFAGDCADSRDATQPQETGPGGSRSSRPLPRARSNGAYAKRWGWQVLPFSAAQTRRRTPA